MRLSRFLFPVLYCLPPLCKWTSNPNPCRVHRSFPGFSLPRLCLCSNYAQKTRCWPAFVRDLELFPLGFSYLGIGLQNSSLVLCRKPLLLLSLFCLPAVSLCNQYPVGIFLLLKGASASESVMHLLAPGQMVEQQLERRPLLSVGKKGRPDSSQKGLTPLRAPVSSPSGAFGL